MTHEETRAHYRSGGWLDRGGGIHTADCPCPSCVGRLAAEIRKRTDVYPELTEDPEAPVPWWSQGSR